MSDVRSVLRAVVRPGEDESFDRVVVEEPLEIRVRGEPIAVTMRTPGDDRDLATGFLLTEGVLRDRADIVEVKADKSSVDVTLAAGLDASRAKRALFSASSCGLCGKETIAAIAVKVPALVDEFSVSMSTLLSLPERMRGAQLTFDHTGGLHAAALFDARGTLEVLREDVGRHNATDKVIGACARDLSARVLLVSGRAGFEIVQKAAVARIPVVAAISAPSSLAIDLADRLGITLVAFLRPPRASIYTHPRRVSV